MNRFGSTFVILNTTARNEGARRTLSRKLQRLGELPQGWNFGEGVPVSSLAIAVGEQLLVMAARLALQADVFPENDGGCVVAFYHDAERVQVSVSPDGRLVELSAERGIGPHFEDVVPPIENVRDQDVQTQALRLATEAAWSLLGSSTYASSTKEAGGSSILSLSNQASPVQTVAGASLHLRPPVLAQI